MNTRFRFFALVALPTLLVLAVNAYPQDDGAVLLTKGLFIGSYVSAIGPTDPVIHTIVEGKNIRASEGKVVEFPNGENERWTLHSADSSGWFKGKYLDGAYGLFEFKLDEDRVALLEAMGNELVYVNGVPRQGNKYGYKDTWEPWEPPFDFSLIPVHFRKGHNQLLFLCNRGMLKARMRYVEPGVLFNLKYTTLPDLLVGQPVDTYAGVTVINATDRPLAGAYIRAYNDSGFYAETRMPLIQPMSVRKVGFKLVGPAPALAGVATIKLQLMSGPDLKSGLVASGQLNLKIVPPTATHNVTFISDIDSSVHYYAVVPPRGPDDGKPKALFLSLHGADVIATNMANSYFPKTWGYIVCPTNGGPYAFDWEDWGRLDALQVLHISKSTMNIDPNRVYLTGHSMGGHGTWIIGAQYPDKFAAIGPSAGWISWWSYAFHRDSLKSPMERMLTRATNPVHTYRLVRNYKQLGIYILHGSEDDNVPTTESINMADTLGKFHKDFVFHKQVGVGHWWGLDDQAGTDCVDWPPMFDFFARHARPGESRILNIDFTTANPGVSAKDYWLTIYSQEKQLEPSRAVVRFIPSRNRFVGTTENVKTLAFDVEIADAAKPFYVDLDNTKLDSVIIKPQGGKIWLRRESGEWKIASRPSPDEKGPIRYGTFKDAFRHGVIFVYGTHGTREENEWAFSKARFDAEYFWYQGGGSIEIVPDGEFNPEANPDRNVILYGNEETNSAWDDVISDCAVKVTNRELTFGDEVLSGKGYACFMVRPRKGSSTASVGVVSGTGVEGMRLTYVVPYLQPWFSLPDVTVLDASIFFEDEGISGRGGLFGRKNRGRIGFGSGRGARIAGFFGLDWSLKNGEFVHQR